MFYLGNISIFASNDSLSTYYTVCNLFWPFFTSFVCLHCVVAVSSFVYIFLGNVLY